MVKLNQFGHFFSNLAILNCQCSSVAFNCWVQQTYVSLWFYIAIKVNFVPSSAHEQILLASVHPILVKFQLPVP